MKALKAIFEVAGEITRALLNAPFDAFNMGGNNQ
jgi:hypothetical protein